MKFLLALLAFTAMASALLFGPAGFRSEPQSAEAAFPSELKKLLASDAQWTDWFGISAAISGDTAIVGANQSDDGSAQTQDGAAYVFYRNQGGADNWGELKKLVASDRAGGDQFGVSVALSGDIAVVGAFLKDAGALQSVGAAYVFYRNQGGADNWGQVKKLLASDGQAVDFFGFSVAVSGDTIVVGEFRDDAGGNDAGAAYVFYRNQGGADNWGEVTKLTASDAQASDNFGVSVALNGDTIFAGAPNESAAATNAGAAYLFYRNQGGADNWGQVKKFTASDAEAGDAFGATLAVSGDTVVVGARLEDAGGIDAGAVYIYQRSQGGADNWGEVMKLTASDAQADDIFGNKVAVSGDIVVVGASFEDAGGTNAGAAYTFRRDEGGVNNWGQVAKLTASDAQTIDEFGSSVAVSGDAGIVGAFRESTVDHWAGAAYVFDLSFPKPTPTPCSPAGCPTQTATSTLTPTPAATPTITPGTKSESVMALAVTAGGSCAGDVCQVATGAAFTLAVDAATAPTTGYTGVQTYLDFGVYDPAASEDGAGPNSCSDSIDNGVDGKTDRFDADCVTVDLVYKPTQIVDEITWPDLDPAIALRAQLGPGLLVHGGLTGLSGPLPVSTFEGTVVSIQMTCPSSPVQATIDMLPYYDPISGTGGSAFLLGPGAPGIVVPNVGSLTIDCVAPPTPTPTATPTPLPVDSDGDGCPDVKENGPDETLGGLRDPTNPWDFYDVSGLSPGVPDGMVDLSFDILGVIQHYSSTGAPPYDVRYDRGATTGPNAWNMTAPDGVIDLANDILGVIRQYGHDCT